ncbi:uncharacterized protein [Centruroides vittatus]|uniref:uncharacterized protein n=1 Tax=Centruroides vittatus TaxID=120091 RepID=UPI00350FD98F
MMKGKLLLILISSLIFTMVWCDDDTKKDRDAVADRDHYHDRQDIDDDGDDDDDECYHMYFYIEQYCVLENYKSFSECFHNAVSTENQAIFYDCLEQQGLDSQESEDIREFLCGTASAEQLQEFDKCVHKNLIQSVFFFLQYECCIIQNDIPFVSFICSFIG